MIEGTQLQLVYTVIVSSITDCHFLTTETIVNHSGDQFRAHPSCIYLYSSCKLYNFLVLNFRTWIFCQSILWWKGWMGKSLLCLLILSVIFKTYLAIYEFFFSLFIYLTKYFLETDLLKLPFRLKNNSRFAVNACSLIFVLNDDVFYQFYMELLVD